MSNLKIVSELLYSVALKSIGGLAHWMDIALMHDFITSGIAYLENIGSLSYTDLPDVDAFHYIVSKNHIY